MFRLRAALAKQFKFRGVKDLDQCLLRLLPEYASVVDILTNYTQEELEEMLEGEILVSQDTPAQIRDIWNDVVVKLTEHFAISKQHLFECLHYLYPGWDADKNRILDMSQRELMKDLRRTVYKRSELKRMALLRRKHSGAVFNSIPLTKEELEFEHLTVSEPEYE